MKKNILLAYLFLATVAAHAQGDLTLYSLRDLHQSTYLNPAFMPRYDLSVGVPALSNIGIETQLGGFNLNTATSNIDKEGVFNLSNFSRDIKGDLFGLKLFPQLDFFHVRQQFGHYQVGLHSGLRVNGQLSLSKDFISFLTQGNGSFAGQNVSFKGTNIQASAYIETGLSVSREFERFSIGVRVKMLNGIANISTSDVNINYYTGSPSFEPTRVTLGGTANTSGLPFLQDSINGEKNTDTNSVKPSDIKPFNNMGFAFDLGMTYRVSPRLNVHASAIDLGAINWKNRTYNYNLNNADITFVGLTYGQINDSAQQARFTDSLKNVIKTKTSKDGYTTPLVSRFIVGADYDLTLRDRVGVMLQLQYFMGTYMPSYNINYTRRVGTNWDITGNYSYYNNSFANVGLGTSVKWGAFQVYLIQDDILFYFLPENFRTFYFRFGCNLVWGQQRPRARL